MGVLDNKERMLYDLNIKRQQLLMEQKIHVQDRSMVNIALNNLAAAKKKRNAQECVVKRLKKEIKSLDAKIKRHGNDVRKWIKAHPGEALDKMGDKYD